MHVLVTADTVGGVWTYTRELVTGLVHRGVRVTLVSFGEIPTAQQTEWMEGLRGLDYRPTAFRLEWMQDAAADIAASSDYLLAVIDEVRPDLLHSSQYCYGALPVDIPKLVVGHSDVISWWVAVHGQAPRESDWIAWYRRTVSAGIAGATAVVAPSQWMLEQLTRYGRAANRSVIYNGRNPGLFNPHASKDDLVVSVGRLWDAGKQVSLLLEHDHKIPVCIAGSDKHPDEVMRGATPARSARRSISFCGPQPHAQLAQLFSRAAMYAATSRYEPFGLAPLEAALSRCVLVANDIPSLREIWDDAALYFDANNAQSLADAIERLRADPGLRSTYANRAYDRARQRFTAGRMVNDYMSLYSSLVARVSAATEAVLPGVTV